MAPDAPDYIEWNLCVAFSRQQILVARKIKKLYDIMNTVSECFISAYSANVWKQWLSVLHLTTHIVNYSNILLGLSNYFFKEARLYAKNIGSGLPTYAVQHTRIQYDQKKLTASLHLLPGLILL